MITEAAKQDLRDRNPVTELAGRWANLRPGKSGRLVGPCPLCSSDPQSRGKACFECWADGWVCAKCNDGGDVIRLVEKHEKLEFLAAVEWLGGTQEPDPVEAARREKAAADKRARADRIAATKREDERERMWTRWNDAVAVPGTPVERYLTEYRHIPVLPGSPPWGLLKATPDMPYFVQRADGDTRGQKWIELHRGWAMLGAIIGPNSKFAGLHITWIDLDQPKGKLVLTDPATGEGLVAKKVRGSAGGGRVELVRDPEARRLIIGEGIETVLSVHQALAIAGRDLSHCAFWTGLSLGNLSGRATEQIRHPTLKDAAGRVRRVPGPVPAIEPDKPGIPVPDSVTEVVLLADGDSDRFTTECAMERAKARFSAEGRRVRIAWPPGGRDFNDMLVA